MRASHLKFSYLLNKTVMETILFKFILVKNIFFGHKLYKYIPMKKHEKA